MPFTAAPAGPPLQEIAFLLEQPGADCVYLCGDFTNWRPAGLRLIGNRQVGLWETRLPVPPGRHEYRFLVDGQWTPDPDAPENVRGSDGSLNSIFEVQA